VLLHLTMTDELLIGTQSIDPDQLLPLLASYQMLPQLRREIIIDQAIATITCSPEEITQAQQQFFQQNQIKSEAELQHWMDHYGVNHSQLPDLMTRPSRIEKFKQLTWGAKLDGHFLTRKTQFDKVLYSLLRVKERGTAQELYFRLQAGEQSFADLAREYSQGPEAQTGGLVGPFELSSLQPNLAQILANSQPGQISQPVYLNEWFVVVRLEKFIAAQLDEPMRQRLINDLFKEWLQQQLQGKTPTSNDQNLAASAA
jgi:parvulin-like peptidyl-prolyl isomerase